MNNKQDAVEQNWRSLPFKEEYLDNAIWHPGKWEDVKYMGKESYDAALKEWQDAEDKVVFKNVGVGYESCDCGDGYGCSHGSWPYEIRVFDEEMKEVKHKIDYEDHDQLFIDGLDGRGITVSKIYNLTLGDFYDCCKMVGINLILNQRVNLEPSVATESASSNAADNQIHPDINEQSYLFGICNWITQQPEYKDLPVTDPKSIFYHIAPMQYAKLIYRYAADNQQIPLFIVKELLKKQREICANEIETEDHNSVLNEMALACRENVLNAPEPPLPTGSLTKEEKHQS